MKLLVKNSALLNECLKKKPYGEFRDNLNRGLIAVIIFRETDRQTDKEAEKRTLRLFFNYLSFIVRLLCVNHLAKSIKAQDRKEIQFKNYQINSCLKEKC
jgi:hypothetical protein